MRKTYVTTIEGLTAIVPCITEFPVMEIIEEMETSKEPINTASVIERLNKALPGSPLNYP